MIEDEKCPICGFIFDSCKHTLIEVFIYAERVRDERNTLRKQLEIAISTLLYYRASGTNDWAEKALAEIEKIGGMNE